MALPLTISNITTPVPSRFNYLAPVISSGGNVYLVVLDSTDLSLIEVHKATDPTDSFAEQDGSNRPDLPANCESLAIDDKDDVIHIASQDANADIEYHTFNMATDAWVITRESVTTTPDGVSALEIAVRDDGDVIILHQGQRDNDMGNKERIDYSRRESGSWGSNVDIQVHNGGAINWRSPRIVKGSSDRMHFFFHDQTNDDIFQRTLNSANSLESFPSAFDTSVSNEEPTVIMHGVSYDDGGTQRVRCPYQNSTRPISMAKLDSADSPTVSLDTDFTTLNPWTNEGIVVGCLAVKEKILQQIYSRALDKSMKRITNDDDAGWGSRIDEFDGFFNEMHCNVFVRSGNFKLAMLKDDGPGTFKYNEIDLGAAAAPSFPPELFKRYTYVKNKQMRR